MSGTDPIRAWLQERQRDLEDAAMSRALTRAAADLGIEDDDQAPNVDSLTPGAQPSEYKPPTVGEQFRQWAREATYR